MLVHIVSATACPSERKHVTLRVRVPPPHVSEHEPNDPSENAYVYATLGTVVNVVQAQLLHVPDVEGFVPEQYESDTLWPSERLQVTERVCVPPPQDAEHDPHEPVEYEYEYDVDGAQA